MILGEQKLTQGRKLDFLCAGFSAVRAKALACQSCPDTEEKQVLRSAYPNFVGAPSCSAQDDTEIVKASVARLKPCPFKAVLFRIC
jgi:hypothetical protein